MKNKYISLMIISLFTFCILTACENNNVAEKSNGLNQSEVIIPASNNKSNSKNISNEQNDTVYNINTSITNKEYLTGAENIQEDTMDNNEHDKNKNIKDTYNEDNSSTKNSIDSSNHSDKSEPNKGDVISENSNDISINSKEKTINNSTANSAEDLSTNFTQYKIINIESISENFKKKIESSKTFDGYLYYFKNNTLYVAVLLGERPTGGFKASISRVQVEKDTLNIEVKEVTPNKDSYVTQVITYPYVILEFDHISLPSHFYIYNTKREEFMNLNVSKAPKSPKEDNIEISNIEYSVVPQIQIPLKINNIMKIYRENTGYYVYKEDEYAYIAIFAGRKSNSGYNIKVVSVTEENNQIKVIVSQTLPKEGYNYLQVITYPYVVIKLKIDNKDIVVMDTQGRKFEPSTSIGNTSY